jgi:hypothetical protein
MIKQQFCNNSAAIPQHFSGNDETIRKIVQRFYNDPAAIPQRFHSYRATIAAQRLRSDCGTIAQRFCSDF